MNRRSLLTALFALAHGGVFGQTRPNKQTAVASFSLLADLLANIAGDRFDVTSLIGPNIDAHAYQPKPSDSRLLAGARLILVNGLGFEGSLDRLIRAAGSKAAIITGSKGIKALKAQGDDHGHAHGEDPHAWQSVANAKIYVANIRDGLIMVDGAGETIYRARAEAYLAQLDQLESDILSQIARVPAADRRVVSSHDAFRYFESAYGLSFIPAQGLAAESEPTATQIAALIRQIRREKVKAVFTENVLSAKLAEQIAKESGAVIGGVLYSDALSDAKGPAATYIDMMRYNARTLISALVTS